MTSLPILLPPGFTPIVSVGDIVTAKQQIASQKSIGNAVVITIADELSIKPADAGKTIKKNPGDEIEPGDIIASNKGFLGMGEQKVMSSVTGKILSFDRRTSELTIQVGEVSGEEEVYLYSPVDGKVTVCDNEKIVVETEKDAIVSKLGYGNHAKGEVLVIKAQGDGPLPLHNLTPDGIGRIIVTPFLDRDGLLKAIGMDVLGIITNMIDEADVSYFTDKGSTVPLLIVADDDYTKLSKLSGKQLFIDGEQKSIVLVKL